jgi:formylglycine-generating enzyme required for sulfatase activity
VAKFPTTQAQWEAVVGDNPSTLRHPDYPVNAVSYDRIQSEFLPALNRKLPGYDFRLPTEAEWEYACRAGTTTDRFFGPEGKVEDYAWVHKPGESYLHPVGLKKPNPWGLYDLTGQVFQWCLDYAHDGYLDSLGDGTAWLEPERNIPERIARGYGPLLFPYDQVSSSKRWSFCPSMTSDYIGFRIVISNILN